MTLQLRRLALAALQFVSDIGMAIWLPPAIALVFIRNFSEYLDIGRRADAGASTWILVLAMVKTCLIPLWVHLFMAPANAWDVLIQGDKALQLGIKKLGA